MTYDEYWRELEARVREVRAQLDAAGSWDGDRQELCNEFVGALLSLYTFHRGGEDFEAAQVVAVEIESLLRSTPATCPPEFIFARRLAYWVTTFGNEDERSGFEQLRRLRAGDVDLSANTADMWASTMDLANSQAVEREDEAASDRYLAEAREIERAAGPTEDIIDGLVGILAGRTELFLDVDRADEAIAAHDELLGLIEAHGANIERRDDAIRAGGLRCGHALESGSSAEFIGGLEQLLALATDHPQVANALREAVDDLEPEAAERGYSTEFFAVADAIGRGDLRRLASEYVSVEADTELPEVEGWNDEILSRGRFVEVLTREDGERKIHGFVVDANERLLLLREEDDWRLDEWIVLPRSATKCVHDRDEPPNVRAFRSEGPHQLDPRFPVDISSLDALFLGLRQAGTPTIIAFPGEPPDDDDDTSFGLIRAAAGGFVFSRQFTTAFEWRWELDVIDYDNVLRVSFGGSYLDFYERHLEPVADYERREREVRATAEEDDS